MTDLVLVRHAETVWHAENRYAGISDVGLTERGMQQAAALGAWARTAGLSAIWSSPLSRCRMTAAPAAAATNLLPRLDDRLRELDFGRIEGLTKDEALAAYPTQMSAYLADPVSNHMDDGEPPFSAVTRAIAALDDIAAAHAGARVLVLAHSTLIRLLLCRLLGLELTAYRARFPLLHNCAPTELRLGGPVPALLSYNVPLGEIETR